MEKGSTSGGVLPSTGNSNMYYSNTASSLSKRPLAEIYTEKGMSNLTYIHIQHKSS